MWNNSNENSEDFGEQGDGRSAQSEKNQQETETESRNGKNVDQVGIRNDYPVLRKLLSQGTPQNQHSRPQQNQTPKIQSQPKPTFQGVPLGPLEPILMNPKTENDSRRDSERLGSSGRTRNQGSVLKVDIDKVFYKNHDPCPQDRDLPIHEVVENWKKQGQSKKRRTKRQEDHEIREATVRDYIKAECARIKNESQNNQKGSELSRIENLELPGFENHPQGALPEYQQDSNYSGARGWPSQTMEFTTVKQEWEQENFWPPKRMKEQNEDSHLANEHWTEPQENYPGVEAGPSSGIQNQEFPILENHSMMNQPEYQSDGNLTDSYQEEHQNVEMDYYPEDNQELEGYTENDAYEYEEYYDDPMEQYQEEEIYHHQEPYFVGENSEGNYEENYQQTEPGASEFQDSYFAKGPPKHYPGAMEGPSSRIKVYPGVMEETSNAYQSVYQNNEMDYYPAEEIQNPEMPWLENPSMRNQPEYQNNGNSMKHYQGEYQNDEICYYPEGPSSEIQSPEFPIHENHSMMNQPEYQNDGNSTDHYQENYPETGEGSSSGIQNLELARVQNHSLGNQPEYQNDGNSTNYYQEGYQNYEYFDDENSREQHQENYPGSGEGPSSRRKPSDVNQQKPKVGRSKSEPVALAQLSRLPQTGYKLFLREKAHRFPNVGADELQQKWNPIWNGMSEEEKKPYIDEVKARRAKYKKMKSKQYPILPQSGYKLWLRGKAKDEPRLNSFDLQKKYAAIWKEMSKEERERYNDEWKRMKEESEKNSRSKPKPATVTQFPKVPQSLHKLFLKEKAQIDKHITNYVHLQKKWNPVWKKMPAAEKYPYLLEWIRLRELRRESEKNNQKGSEPPRIENLELPGFENHSQGGLPEYQQDSNYSGARGGSSQPMIFTTVNTKWEQENFRHPKRKKEQNEDSNFANEHWTVSQQNYTGVEVGPSPGIQNLELPILENHSMMNQPEYQNGGNSTDYCQEEYQNVEMDYNPEEGQELEGYTENDAYEYEEYYDDPMEQYQEEEMGFEGYDEENYPGAGGGPSSGIQNQELPILENHSMMNQPEYQNDGNPVDYYQESYPGTGEGPLSSIQNLESARVQNHSMGNQSEYQNGGNSNQEEYQNYKYSVGGISMEQHQKYQDHTS